jgi:hypothetical protein
MRVLLPSSTDPAVVKRSVEGSLSLGRGLG